MNASASRKRVCRSICSPEIELVEEEVRVEGEEITIVNEEKANSEGKGRSGYYFHKILESDDHKQNAPTPDILLVPGNSVGMKGIFKRALSKDRDRTIKSSQKLPNGR